MINGVLVVEVVTMEEVDPVTEVVFSVLVEVISLIIINILFYITTI